MKRGTGIKGRDDRPSLFAADKDRLCLDRRLFAAD
jgi:hypothetical protein